MPQLKGAQFPSHDVMPLDDQNMIKLHGQSQYILLPFIHVTILANRNEKGRRQEMFHTLPEVLKVFLPPERISSPAAAVLLC